MIPKVMLELSAEANQTLAVATGAFELIWLLIAFPLFGAAVLILGGNRTNTWGPILGVFMPISSLVLSLYLWAEMLALPSNQRGQNQILFET